MREFRSYGSGRGALSDERPYREFLYDFRESNTRSISMSKREVPFFTRRSGDNIDPTLH